MVPGLGCVAKITGKGCGSGPSTFVLFPRRPNLNPEFYCGAVGGPDTLDPSMREVCLDSLRAPLNPKICHAAAAHGAVDDRGSSWGNEYRIPRC